MTASDIQEDVTIDGDTVSGTLHYVADWSSAGFDPEDGTNFIALHAVADGNSTIVAEAVPSQGTPSVPFNNDDAVFQVNSDTTGIKFTVTRGDESKAYTFTLDATLEEE